MGKTSDIGDIGSRSPVDANRGYPIEDWDRWAGTTKAICPGPCWQRYERAEQAGWSKAGLREAQCLSEKIGSAAVMVVFNGAVLAHWGQIERRFMCHSMRKSLLSALFGQSVEQGLIDLEETLGTIDIDDHPPLTDAEKSARILDLLTSRSGIYLPAAYETQHAKEQRPARGSHAPGNHWYYNNWDFNVLGRLFNQKTGGDLFETFDRQLAKPLQMQDFLPRHGYYHFERQSSIHPAYPFRMSARDLARFGLLFMRDGQWQGRQLVPSSWIHESTSSNSETPRGGYGYMWWIETSRLGALGTYFASGVGGHRIYIVPRAQLVVVHRTNTYRNGPHRIGDEEMRDLIDKVLRARTGPPVAKPSLIDMIEPMRSNEEYALAESEMAALSGNYDWRRGRLTIRRDNNRLELESPRHGRSYFVTTFI